MSKPDPCLGTLFLTPSLLSPRKKYNFETIMVHHSLLKGFSLEFTQNVRVRYSSLDVSTETFTNQDSRVGKKERTL